MEAIKVVLLFNPEDERQNAVGQFLKTQKRCKTAFITEIVSEWLVRKENEKLGISNPTQIPMKKIKDLLLADEEFISAITRINAGKPTEEKRMDAEKMEGFSEFDMDEEMLLAGLSMFEAQI